MKSAKSEYHHGFLAYFISEPKLKEFFQIICCLTGRGPDIKSDEFLPNQ
ncbi:Uncharacterized protein dnm_038630 [Desulfonema magnum]|uniref:Uncharacterized protein n=1 Tax=Desulfonema magnum TaxID=45655 RepID=A0A975BLS2_9BACT|nr:Uncharacterized protein dnm_038630 [Desulfonema magnum]